MRQMCATYFASGDGEEKQVLPPLQLAEGTAAQQRSREAYQRRRVRLQQKTLHHAARL